jgi:predicted Zn-dependent protease with MMP-like domain
VRRGKFEELVRRALEALPEEFLRRIDNVDLLVRPWPTPEQVTANRVPPDETLYGLYEGVPLTDRAGYNMVLPDTITIFQGPMEADCVTSEEIMEEVRVTVVHEFAHHFGISDEQLEEWGVA